MDHKRAAKLSLALIRDKRIHTLFALLTEARNEIEDSADTAREFDLIARIDAALKQVAQP